MRKWIQSMFVVLLLFSIAVFAGIGYGNFIFPGTIEVVKETEYALPVLYSLPDSTDSAKEIRLLHTIPVKKSTVKSAERTFAVPLGRAFGIKLYTDGVIVVRTDGVPTDSGSVSPAKEAGIRAGDAILSINGEEMHTNARTAELFMQSEGKALELKVRRETLVFKTTIRPVLSNADQKYHAGIWVRDSSAGIGTMTFYVPKYNLFGGLGHAVCDVDTGKIMPLSKGEAVSAKIKGSYKGKSGTPGELCGTLGSQTLGNIVNNDETGIYVFSKPVPSQGEMLPVAMYYEVQEGPAEILAEVDESGVQRFSVEITKLYENPDARQKNLIIKVTDPALMDKTGGIVQGMSGSPIIQNGMLIGAVTHVFINDPLQGFGIYAQTMLSEMEKLYSNIAA